MEDPREAAAREHLAAEPSLQASAKDLLIADLKRLRQEAGMPSLGELVRLGKGKYSKSTLDDHLAGRRTTVPNWRLTSAYIDACYTAAEETGLNIELLGAKDEWRIRWSAARDGDRNAASPIRDAGSTATRTMLENPQSDAGSLSRKLEYLDRPESGLLEGSAKAKRVSRSVTGDTTANINAVTQLMVEPLLNESASLPRDVGVLIIISGPLVGTRFHLTSNLTTIGRDPGADIVLHDTTLSRRHAVIHRNGSRFMVRDVGSRNGTFVRQRMITEETALKSNTEVQFGVFRMLFIQGSKRKIRKIPSRS
jgi:hypothetical protein